MERESERLRREASELVPKEEAYAATMNDVHMAATLLNAAEPTMTALVKQHEWATGTGAIFDPNLFQRLARNANVDAQVKLAKAVCAFVQVWRGLRDAALAGTLG